MSDKRNRKKGLGISTIKEYSALKRRTVLSFLYVILTVAFVIAMVIMEILPEPYRINVGEAANETIYAIGDVVDEVKTNEKKQQAKDAVADIYTVDAAVTNTIMEYFENTVFKGFVTVSNYGYNIRDGQENTGGYIVQYDPVKQAEYGEKELSFIKSSTDMLDESAMTKAQKIIVVLDSNPQDIDRLKEWFNERMRSWLGTGIRENELTAKRESIVADIRNAAVAGMSTSNKLRHVLAEVVEEYIKPNSFLDVAATEEARKSAADKIENVIIPKGTAIVTENTIVTQSQYDMLNKLGMLEEGNVAYHLVIGSVAIVFVFLVLIVMYVYIFDKKTFTQPKKIFLLCLLIMVNILIALLLKSGGWEKMMNAALSTVIIAMLFNEYVAITVNTALSVILAMFITDEAGVFTTDAIALMISSITGGTIAVYSCRNIRKSSTRLKMLVPGVLVGVVGMVTAFAVMWTAGREITLCVEMALYCLGGGAITALFTAGSISVWEGAFGLITQSKLLELSSTSGELLSKLNHTVSGTYRHSMMVADLAENGARDIGADPMLARVGALYHDIGKIRLPECYTENQTEESRNFHDTLDPSESAKMIFSHITEGVQIAKSYKLPQEIIDIIQQHHGTSAVMYFYNKAKAMDPNVDINDFRYPGPAPLTKEAGIILLADCVEASVRSMDEKTHENISAQIERMFKARMDDGELDDCALTLKDINVLKNSFLQSLTAVYHSRIKYDNQEKK